MTVGSNSEPTGPEKGRPEVIIDSEELMVEIDYSVLLFVDFGDVVALRGFRYFAHIDEHRRGRRFEPLYYIGRKR